MTAGPLIRSVATAGGNVGCGRGDLVPALLVLDAGVHLDDGTAMPMTEYLAARPRDRIITRFTWSVTAEDGWSATTVKLARRGMDWPIVTVAVAVRLRNDGWVEDARVAAAALTATPVLLSDVGAALVASRGNADTVAGAVDAACRGLDVRSDTNASARVRRPVVPTVVVAATRLAADLGPDRACDVQEALR